MAASLFQPIFGDSWERLPPVMHKHYAVLAGSNDVVKTEGALDVKSSWYVRLLARLTGALVPYEGQAVPVTVTFSTKPETGAFHFDREFRFPGKKPVHFRSYMQPVGGNELVEWMRFGFGWRCAYHWDGTKVILQHRGYAWRCLGFIIPLPLELLIGKGYAEELPLSDTSFSMWTHTKHAWFGETFRYSGVFHV